MARITEKNPMYRTKQQMCIDISEVLNSKTLSHGTKRSVVDHVLWVWSEFHGKYDGCPFWSVAAIEAGEEDSELIHDHAIPRKLLRAMLFRHDLNAHENVIKNILETYCVGAVITKEEDGFLNSKKLRSSMPHNWNEEDAWSRYREANIKIIRVEDSKEMS
jgi:hypothetical protein